MKTIDPDRWKRLESVLDGALELSLEARGAFLARACRDDPQLLAMAQRLIEADAAAGGFLESVTTPSLPTSSVRDDRAPDRVGVWRIVKELGRGGMGVVYLAERTDGTFEQRVALKIVKRGMDTDEVIRRFVFERRILARLEHPHIARLIDGGTTEDGRPYFAMELVDGTPITTYAKQHALSLSDKVRIFRTVCEAVAFAQRNLVVHRDLKPSNVLVTSEGGVKLLDFGIAKLLDAESSGESLLTREGSSPMTPVYAAPEQVRGAAITTATDVYSLGVLLYELVAERRPQEVTGKSLEEVRKAILEIQPAKMPHEVPSDLARITYKALAKEPERRYFSAEALLEDLDRYASGQPVQAHPPTFNYRAAKFIQRNKIALAAATLIFFAILAGLAGTAWQARVASREARRAERVTEFLVSLFQSSDPDVAQGTPMTALELLENGTKRIDLELADEPEVRADLLDVLSRVYFQMSQFKPAVDLGRRSVALRMQPPRNDLRLAGSLMTLGRALTSAGNFDSSKTCLEEAVGFARKAGEPGRETTMAALEGLGDVLYLTDHIEEAERTYRDGLALTRIDTKSEMSRRASLLGSLGSVLSDRNRYDEAEAILRESLQYFEAGSSVPTLARATVMAGLGETLRRQGRLAEAESTLTEAVEVIRGLQSEDHIDLAQSLNALGGVRNMRRDWVGARQAYEEGLAVALRVSGEDSPVTGSLLMGLGIVRSNAGDTREGADLIEKAIAIYGRTVGEGHFNTLTARKSLSATLWNVDPDRSEQILRDVIFEGRKSLGEENRLVFETMGDLGRLLFERNRVEEGEKLIRDTIERAAPALGAEDIVVARAQLALGRLLLDRENYTEAESNLRAAMTSLEKLLSPEDPLISLALTRLAEVLITTQRSAEALPLLERALEQRRKTHGAEHETTAFCDGLLGLCLLDLGRTQEARAHFMEALPRLRRGSPDSRALAQRIESAEGRPRADASAPLSSATNP